MLTPINDTGVRMRFPLVLRFALVAGIALALLLPLSMIQQKIAERRDRAAAVQSGFAEETSGPQTLAGPFIALTCEETYVHERTQHLEDGKRLTVREKRKRQCPTQLVLPRELTVAGSVPVEGRYRGIYPIRLYRAGLELSGAFALPPPPAAGADSGRVWKDAYLVLAISDVRGIKEAAVRVGAVDLEFIPGTHETAIKSGLHARLGAYAALQKELQFRIPIELAGTTKLSVAPLGSQSDIRLSSEWPHPSFIGGYSPDRREISAGGFAASWRVNDLATGGNAFWLDAAAGDKLFGASRLVGFALADPVNPYSMSYRATEYGFLFVLLTFAAFALVEVIWGVRLHAVQYALAGSALAVFFLLLIALSEHVFFGWAYLAAASACVALLTWYLRHPLGSFARTSVFGALFAALYGALYVLLRSEDHSLLLGALLVFGMLAAVMVLTRKLDWAELSRRLAPGTGSS
jgi:inner membrane protein